MLQHATRCTASKAARGPGLGSPQGLADSVGGQGWHGSSGAERFPRGCPCDSFTANPFKRRPSKAMHVMYVLVCVHYRIYRQAGSLVLCGAARSASVVAQRHGAMAGLQPTQAMLVQTLLQAQMGVQKRPGPTKPPKKRAIPVRGTDQGVRV